MANSETKYEQVYGKTFADYRRADMDEFIEPLAVRYAANGLRPSELFAGQRCLDAGCGNGRGTLFMAAHGAREIEALDFSQINVESTRRFAKNYGYDNVTVSQGTIEALPFDSASFDFVWCNGVLMHTAHPNHCLSELARVLKTGGHSWIYVYGSGGIYWRTIQHLRSLMKDIDVACCQPMLKLMRYEPRYVAEFIDDWYAVHLRTYTAADLEARLVAVGFEQPELLPYGVSYDTSHRRFSASTNLEREMMGEGDLRYLLTRAAAAPSAPAAPIDEGEYGSDYQWPASIEAIEPAFAAFREAVGGSAWTRVAAGAHLQRELRLLLTAPGDFQLPAFLDHMTAIARLAVESGR